MSRTFDRSATNYQSSNVGGNTNIGNGAYTIICLFNITAGNNNSGLISFRSAGGVQAQLIVDTNQLFGAGDFQGGQTGITTGAWWWAAIRFPGGTNLNYTYSLRAYNSGSTSHTTGTSNNHSDSGTACTEIRLGHGDDIGNASIAVWASWATVLADGTVAGMFTTAAADIVAQSPLSLWLGNQGSSATLVPDSIGTASGSSFTGTVGIGSDPTPPTYDYSLTSVIVLGGSSTNRHPGAGPGTARFYQTPRPTDIAAAGTAWDASPAADSVGLTDTVALEQDKAQTDSVGLTDTVALEQDKVATDSVGLTDTTAITQAKVITDDTGLTDSSTLVLAKVVTQTDDTGLTDTFALSATHSVTDDAGLTDTQAITRSLVLSDSAGLTDTSSVTLTHALTQTDTTGLTDTSTTTATYAPTLVDLVGLTDTAVTAGGSTAQPPRYGLDGEATATVTDGRATGPTTDQATHGAGDIATPTRGGTTDGTARTTGALT